MTRPALLLSVPLLAASVPQAPDLARCLPELPGWTASGQPGRYGPDTLFDYINGAAESFLDCGFRELVTQAYEAPGGRSVSVDVFRHEGPEAAFGIYSQELSPRATFLDLGAQGYAEPGVLNFFQGDCYVKLSGFHLGAEERETLTRFARAVAARIPGEARMPAHLAAFPAEGRVARSERYLLKNVLGYPYLGPAYSAEYRFQAQEMRAWIIVAPQEAAARTMLDTYLKAQGPELPREPGNILAVTDRFHGPLALLARGRHLLLVTGGDAARRERLLRQLGAGLGAP